MCQDAAWWITLIPLSAFLWTICAVGILIAGRFIVRTLRTPND